MSKKCSNNKKPAKTHFYTVQDYLFAYDETSTRFVLGKNINKYMVAVLGQVEDLRGRKRLCVNNIRTDRTRRCLNAARCCSYRMQWRSPVVDGIDHPTRFTEWRSYPSRKLNVSLGIGEMKGSLWSLVLSPSERPLGARKWRYGSFPCTFSFSERCNI